MRVVIDTNVFVSSFFGGKPKQIIDLWISGELYLCMSQEILEEYVAVLTRLGLKNEWEIGKLLDIFARNYHTVFTAETPKLSTIVQKDPDDDKFIECAVALGAEYVISGDKALLDVVKYINISILSPADFLEIIRNKR